MTMLIRCIDVETSGLDPTVHGVVEIATVDVIINQPSMVLSDKVMSANVQRGEMWSSLVNPGHEIPPSASAIHDITDDMVKDAPKIGQLSIKIGEGPPDYYCAHNNRFDSKFIEPFGARWLDTYRIALWLWPHAPEHKLHTLRYWLKLNLSLKDDSDRTRSHRAAWDAYVCAAVLRRAFTSGATIEQMVDVSSQPALLPRLIFGKHAMKPIEDVPMDYLDWVIRQDMDEDVKHTAFTELQRRRNLLVRPA